MKASVAPRVNFRLWLPHGGAATHAVELDERISDAKDLMRCASSALDGGGHPSFLMATLSPMPIAEVARCVDMAAAFCRERPRPKLCLSLNAQTLAALESFEASAGSPALILEVDMETPMSALMSERLVGIRLTDTLLHSSEASARVRMALDAFAEIAARLGLMTLARSPTVDYSADYVLAPGLLGRNVSGRSAISRRSPA